MSAIEKIDHLLNTMAAGLVLLAASFFVGYFASYAWDMVRGSALSPVREDEHDQESW